MKDVNEIVRTIFENIKGFNLDYANTTIKENIDGYNVIVDIRIEKERQIPYDLINTIPRPFMEKTEENVKE